MKSIFVEDTDSWITGSVHDTVIANNDSKLFSKLEKQGE